MGYRTSYTLGTYDSEKDIFDILSQLSEKDFDGLYYAVDECGDCCDSVGWYNHEESMRKLSFEYPDVVFELYGEGENNGDMWNKYFKNGKMQHCPARVIFDDYDEDELR